MLLNNQYLISPCSRALILLHSPEVNPASISEACQNCGVLYYLRPEFHSRGVTFLSYFDHRAAIDAHKKLAGSLGSAANASCHFSVMLHTANNSDESKIVLKKLGAGNSESEVEQIFSRLVVVFSFCKHIFRERFHSITHTSIFPQKI